MKIIFLNRYSKPDHRTVKMAIFLAVLSNMKIIQIHCTFIAVIEISVQARKRFLC